jgi:SPP1 family predicted phage head-tail adaptor
MKGRLKKRVSVYKMEKTDDGRGGQKREYSNNLGSLWVSIQPLSVREMVSYETKFGIVNTKMYCRPVYDIDDTCVIIWGDRYYEVKAVFEPEESDRFVTMICEKNSRLGDLINTDG